MTDDLEEAIEQQWRLLRNHGITPRMYDEGDGWISEDMETEREEMMYHAGKIAGLTQARESIDNEQ